MYCACYVDLYKALLLDYELELELHTLTQAAHLICARLQVIYSTDKIKDYTYM